MDSGATEDLSILRYNDTGVQQSTPFAINRSTGLVTLGTGTTLGGAITLGGTTTVTGGMTVSGALAATGGVTISGAPSTMDNVTIGNTTPVTGRFIYVRTNALGAGTATGSTQADALVIANGVNLISSAAAGAGVVLPVIITGMLVTIYNDSAVPIKVYGNGSQTIDGIAGATGVTLTNGRRAQFQAFVSSWKSALLGAVSS